MPKTKSTGDSPTKPPNSAAAKDASTDTLSAALLEVWRQALVERAPAVKLGASTYPVTTLKSKRLRQVAFPFEGETIIGIEQNPSTKSRWAQLARSGKKVMQFIQGSRYLAVVADGKVTLYAAGKK
jgi:hypothetical protein